MSRPGTPTPPTSGATNAQRWAAYLHAAMTRRFGTDYHNVDLVRASGKEIKDNTVSRWLAATLADAPSPKLVRAAARALGLDENEALTAAGHLGDSPEDRERANARRWQQWITARAAERGIGQDYPSYRDYFLAATAPEQSLDPDTLKRWWEGTEAPDPMLAALAAVILDIDPVEALRAAGHEDVAEVAQALIRAGDPHTRRAAQLVTDPDTRERLIAEYEADKARAAELLELRAQQAAGNGAR